MVPTVLHDLRYWWNGERIRAEINADFHCSDSDFPWAEITITVSGEADIACARLSKLTGAAVLTNDSDMMIHDLGSQGAVILLNSMYLVEDHTNQYPADLRGSMIFPRDVCARLGIPDIRRFAFELKNNPKIQFNDLVRRSKEAIDSEKSIAEYDRFSQEFRPLEDQSRIMQNSQGAADLDPRISELYWQFERPNLFCTSDGPHIYLGILFEDPSRRCAWEQGRMYRGLAYSLLNLSQPQARRQPVVHEFVRRGKRIVSHQIELLGEDDAAASMDLLLRQFDFARAAFGAVSGVQFWVLFALSEICRYSSSTTMSMDATQIQHLLQTGHLGHRPEWADVHIMAQLHAVIYSLTTLKQLFQVSRCQDGLTHHSHFLSDLPSLKLLLGSLRGMTQGLSRDDIVRLSTNEMFEVVDDD